jgi:hypothetical protein
MQCYYVVPSNDWERSRYKYRKPLIVAYRSTVLLSTLLQGKKQTGSTDTGYSCKTLEVEYAEGQQRNTMRTAEEHACAQIDKRDHLRTLSEHQRAGGAQ